MDRIRVENVSKRYRLGEQRNVRETLTAALTRRKNDARDLWSLRNVTFSVADGEAVGIVGRNGAGKSTVLKVLMRITAPTLGQSRTRGRVAGLLEVGTGFHPELTGRENVFLNAAILGMSRRETLRRFDEIVDFAGTERFLDTPVKRYSSGMYLRLAFAVAAHLEPDILIVDEVLAVGDAEFQRKCLRRMSTAGAEGRTVLFVSHDLSALSRLCSRALWLEAGQVRDVGPAATIVRDYLASGLQSSSSGGTLLRSGPVIVRDVRVLPADGSSGSALFREDPFVIRVEFDLAEEVPGLDLTLFVTTPSGVRVFDEALSDHGTVQLAAGSHCAQLTVPPVLNFGDFTVGLWMGTMQRDFVHEPALTTFTLVGTGHDRLERALVLNAPFEIRPASPAPDGAGSVTGELDDD